MEKNKIMELKILSIRYKIKTAQFSFLERISNFNALISKKRLKTGKNVKELINVILELKIETAQFYFFEKISKFCALICT